MAEKNGGHLRSVPTIKVNAETGEVEGTGKTLEELAEEANEEAPGFMRGSNRQLTLDVGGRTEDITASRIKIKGGDFPLIGQFPQNKRVRITMEVEIISFKTVRDRDGFRVGRDRIHHAVIVETPTNFDALKK
jgi:hypothetical protein